MLWCVSRWFDLWHLTLGTTRTQKEITWEAMPLQMVSEKKARGNHEVKSFTGPESSTVDSDTEPSTRALWLLDFWVDSLPDFLLDFIRKKKPGTEAPGNTGRRRLEQSQIK